MDFIYLFFIVLFITSKLGVFNIKDKKDDALCHGCITPKPN